MEIRLHRLSNRARCWLRRSIRRYSRIFFRISANGPGLGANDLRLGFFSRISSSLSRIFPQVAKSFWFCANPSWARFSANTRSSRTFSISISSRPPDNSSHISSPRSVSAMTRRWPTSSWSYRGRCQESTRRVRGKFAASSNLSWRASSDEYEIIFSFFSSASAGKLAFASTAQENDGFFNPPERSSTRPSTKFGARSEFLKIMSLLRGRSPSVTDSRSGGAGS